MAVNHRRELTTGEHTAPPIGRDDEAHIRIKDLDYKESWYGADAAPQERSSHTGLTKPAHLIVSDGIPHLFEDRDGGIGAADSQDQIRV